MPGDRLPLVILGGSDRQPVTLPQGGEDKHPLSGYKGMDIRIQGRAMVELVIERLRESGRFDPIYLVGPAAVYERLAADARLVDADGTFGQNIKIAVETARRENPDRPIGFITCDVIPEVDTLHALLSHYDQHAPCDVWFPMIHAPDRDRLGASAWKPGYRVVPVEGQPAVEILPGHLAIVDPAALRLAFIYRLMQLGYKTRNRSITYRRGVMVRGVVLALLLQDLLHLVSFRAPTLTWTVLSTGISAARRLKAGTITREQLEKAVRKLMITSRHRRKNRDRRVVLPIVEGLSLAMDIDTVEEARQLGGKIKIRSA